jgi:hypothetical protein
MSEVKLSVNDFKPAEGRFEGSLTYLDYKSGKPYTLPAKIMIAINENNRNIIFSYEYPNEPKANGNDTLRISKDGTLLDNAIVIQKKINADSSLQIITEREGKDGNDNQIAVLRHTYIISNKVFINRKEVRFKGEVNWIKRNEYHFTR